MRTVVSVFVFVPFLFICSILAQAQQNDGQSLGEIARQAQQRKSAMALFVDPTSLGRLLLDGKSPNDEVEQNYAGNIALMLARSDFDGLDREASSVRTEKSRFPGGDWKLYVFYLALESPLDGGKALDVEWKDHIERIGQWISYRPESVTARIALAEAYLGYAWKARGHRNSFSEEGGELFIKRGELARVALMEAERLSEKCPYWYSAMVQVALVEGWNKAQTKALVDASIAYDPTFQHVNRLYANYLQTEWYGSEGDMQEFADKTYRLLGGGNQGAFAYFEIAELVCGRCGDSAELKAFSWPTLKRGEATMEKMYGISNLKLNRFAYMARLFGDQVAAKRAFTLINARWESSVWRNSDEFDAANAWALK